MPVKMIMSRTFLVMLASLLCWNARAETLVIQPVQIPDLETGAVLADRAVQVTDGRIVAITAAHSAPSSGARVIDGGGGWLIPGLAEMHAHVPSARRGEQYTRDVLDLFLANGITTIRGMLGEASHLELRERLDDGRWLGPRLITSGPSFNGNSVDSPEQGARRVQEQVAAGYDFLKIHPGLTRDEFLAIAKAAKAAGIPFAGHVSYATGLDTALAAGQATIDHLDAYAEALVPAESALAGTAPQFFGLNLAAELTFDRVAAVAAATASTGVWQVPTQSLFETTAGQLAVESLTARPGMDMLSDNLLAQWVDSVHSIRASAKPADREHFLAVRRALIRALQEAGAGLLLGSDAPQIMNVPGYSTHQELAFLVASGLSPLEALRTGTVNVARFFGDAQGGRVAEGAPADLLLLDGNPLEDISNTTRIRGVMRAGTWLDRERLDKLLAGVRSRGL